MPTNSSFEEPCPLKAKSPKFLIFLTVFIDLLGFGIVLPIAGFIAVDYVKSGVSAKLTADLAPGDSVIRISDPNGFPEKGTVTIGRETIAYEALDAEKHTLGTADKPVRRALDRSRLVAHSAEKSEVELLSPKWPYWIGLLSSVFSICQMLFAPLWGRLSDRVGRRPVLLISLLGSAISYTMFGLAGSFAMLLLARTFAGICGANIPVAQAYIADITEEKDRSSGMALIGVAFGLGFTLGPALGGLGLFLADKFAPHAPSQLFPGLLAGAICMLNFLWAVVSLPESLPVEKRGTATARREHARLKDLLGSLSHPLLGPLILIFFLATLGFSGFEFGFGLFIKGNFSHGLGQHQLELLFVYMGFVMILVQGGIARRLLKVVPETIMALSGMSLLIAGLLLLPLIPNFWWLIFAVTFVASGQALASPAMLGLVSKSTSAEHQGETMGLTQSASALGRILGPNLGGLMIAQGTVFFGEAVGLGSPFWVGAGMIFLAAWMTVVVRGRMMVKGEG